MRIRFAPAAILVALVGCGGGGSTNTSSPSQSTAPPVGSFLVSPTGSALVGVTVMSFNATASDPGGTALSYTWDFGDGQRGFTGQNVTHVYQTAGTFAVA